MIRYRLICARGHEFGAWFASSASYETQAADGQVCCPDCGNRNVAKAIMAPAVTSRARDGGQGAGAVRTELLSVLREIRRGLLARSEDTGVRFPEEARKIYYGEAEERAIHGTASKEEARALIDEGIEVLALPPLPEDAN